MRTRRVAGGRETAGKTRLIVSFSALIAIMSIRPSLSVTFSCVDLSCGATARGLKGNARTAERVVVAGNNTRVGEISFPDNHLTVLCVAS